MKQKTASAILATALGLGGLTTGLVIAPAMASAATSETTATAAVGDRPTKIKDSLKGLVTDGTITQAQADKVATALDEALPKRGPGGGGRHHGRPGPGLDTAATTLGVTPQELRTALQAGTSLADVAAEKGVAKDKLISALVDEEKAHLADRVTQGAITQAQADARAAQLTDRVTTTVERKGRPERPGRGPDMDDAPAPAPSPTA